MLNISFLAFTKVELWDLIICIAVNGEKFHNRAITLTLVSIDRLIFQLSHKNMETWKHRNTETHTDADEYSIVLFCKNATIKICYSIQNHSHVTLFIICVHKCLVNIY